MYEGLHAQESTHRSRILSKVRAMNTKKNDNFIKVQCIGGVVVVVVVVVVVLMLLLLLLLLMLLLLLLCCCCCCCLLF